MPKLAPGDRYSEALLLAIVGVTLTGLFSVLTVGFVLTSSYFFFSLGIALLAKGVSLVFLQIRVARLAESLSARKDASGFFSLAIVGGRIRYSPSFSMIEDFVSGQLVGFRSYIIICLCLWFPLFLLPAISPWINQITWVFNMWGAREFESGRVVASFLDLIGVSLAIYLVSEVMLKGQLVDVVFHKLAEAKLPPDGPIFDFARKYEQAMEYVEFLASRRGDYEQVKDLLTQKDLVEFLERREMDRAQGRLKDIMAKNVSPEWESFWVLELPPWVDGQTVKGRFRELSKRYHPDKNSSPEGLATQQRITEAYQRIQLYKGLK